ncbi:MAG: hypothetical protein K2I72_01755, partial [Bacilli bacterium]|nr:hypothetical protein [Bacilli bacterium]
ISSAALFYRVLNNMKDPEIIVRWSGESLLDEYRKLHREIDVIAEQCPEAVSVENGYFKELRSMNIDGYMLESYITDEHGSLEKWYDQPYNLIVSLAASGKIKWIRELLTSDILTGKLEMFDDFVKNTKIEFTSLVNESDYPDSIYPELHMIDDVEEKKKESIDKIKNLIKLWVGTTVTDKEIQYKLANEMSMENLEFVQKNGIVDFTRDLTYRSGFGDVAAPAHIYCRDNGKYYFGSFYDTESYRELSEEIRQNTDKFLIHNIIKTECHELDRLIKLQNFKVTDENVREIISAIISNYDEAQYHINRICEAIEKKATTPKEYRKAKQYTQQIRDALDPEKLEQQRQAFLTHLINMNENLQGKVPGGVKIKEIQFQLPNKQ